jgi:regulator of protease activity HflC (stomatin/prohibitin superfamily)
LWAYTTVADHQRGIRRRNGRTVAWLEPGRHIRWFPAQSQDELLDLTPGFVPYTPELASVVPAGAATVLEVPFRHLAILKVDGLPVRSLLPGKYLLWQVRNRVEAEVYDLTSLHTPVPEALWRLVPGHLLQTQVVLQHERMVLYVDGAVVEVLGPGSYGLDTEGRTLAPVRVDLREQELVIAGQDLMTSDKVTLRVNLHVRFRITDPVLALSSVTSIRDALYSETQMSARRLLGGMTLDALLEARNGASDQMLGEVLPRAAAWGVQIMGIDLKDVILPGEMKTILNQVIEAEKRAAANVILRREETAATRSLANTAKLLEQNPVLLRLKELESLERQAEKVGSVTVVASPEKLLGTMKM